MKICFVGPANSAHIEKWCTWFGEQGHEIHVISFTPGQIAGANVHHIDLGVDANGSDIGKLKYLLTGKRIKRTIHQIHPDIVNAHYATSYGIAMALSGIKDYILSVWGSDIYDFPNKSILHRALLKYSLKKATHLFSTSQAMADEARKYTNKKFDITPFGVDMELFHPNKRTRTSAEPFTIGTIKTLSDFYGIECFIKAAAKIATENPKLDIAVRIAGSGPKYEEYVQLAKKLGIEDKVAFLGRISQAEAATEWANMNVAIIPSVLYESFGVAAVEAQACGNTVIVSDVAGLLETTSPNRSSLVVPTKDESATADAILKLYQDSELQKKLGENRTQNIFKTIQIDTSFEKEITAFFTVSLSIVEQEHFVVGTVKGLSEKYGIKNILEAVAKIKSEGNIPIRLRIAGKGPQEQEYRQLAKVLGIGDITKWLGFISQEQAAEEWANMDVAIIPSTLESFGVSAVEAQACGTAIIISDIPGLMEATSPNVTSIVVKRNDAECLKAAIEKLYSDRVFRSELGKKGSEYVRIHYEINVCFLHIQKLFQKYFSN